MLDASLGMCYSQRFPDIYGALKAAVQSVHLGGVLSTELCAPLASLASSMGISSSSSTILCDREAAMGGRAVADRDLDLCWALARLDLASSSHYKEELLLLPAAASALFVCDRWEKAGAMYLPQFEAFQNNEHCIQVALSRLLPVFFVLSTCNLGGQLHTDGGSSSSSHDEQKSATDQAAKKKLFSCCHQADRDDYRSYVERYLSLSAQALLTQREIEASSSSSHSSSNTHIHFPHRSMSALLEYFVSLCPSDVVHRGMLEKHFTNYLAHSDLVDVSLGRHKHSHALRPFAHRSSSSAQEED